MPKPRWLAPFEVAQPQISQKDADFRQKNSGRKKAQKSQKIEDNLFSCLLCLFVANFLS
jgi:hypothetical protein